MVIRLRCPPAQFISSHLPCRSSQEILCAVLLLLCSSALSIVHAHNDGAPATPCKYDRGITVQAAFRPGIITVDANSKDWADVEAYQFPLLPALNPDPSQKFPMDPGSIQIKSHPNEGLAVHDGRDVFFNLEFRGNYVYKDGLTTSCPSVALMFGVGDDATYHNMGGCPETPGTCSSTTCNGYAVDIMHFSISNAIPGRLYGSNLLDNLNGTGADRFGNLNDVYGWNPHCRYLDGAGPNDVQGSGAQNDWQGAWTHTNVSLDYGLVQGDSPYGSDGEPGFYIFEFARPLRTNDRLQQDVQFTIGGTSPFGAAVWYPVDGAPWHPSGHYSANCAWIPLKILAAKSASHTGTAVVDTLSILSVFIALAALGTACFVAWWVKSFNPRGGFQGIPNL